MAAPPATTNATTPSSSRSASKLQPDTFLWSAFACGLAFLVVATRGYVWCRRLVRYQSNNRNAYLADYVQPPSSAPLKLGCILLLSLGLRGLWSLLKYEQLSGYQYIKPSPWLLLLDRAPLLLLLSAFSKMSLYWMEVFVPNKGYISQMVIYSNIFLYVATGLQVAGSFFKASIIEPHSVFYITVLLAISVWCMILSCMFSIFGWRLRKSLLLQESFTPLKLRSALNRILAATIICTFMFALRGVIFLSRTIAWNLEHKMDDSNEWIYPLAVYTLPDVVGSISIMFCMDVEADARAVGITENATKQGANIGSRRTFHHYNQASGAGSLNRGSFLSSEGSIGSGEEGLLEALSDEMSPTTSPSPEQSRLRESFLRT